MPSSTLRFMHLSACRSRFFLVLKPFITEWIASSPHQFLRWLRRTV